MTDDLLPIADTLANWQHAKAGQQDAMAERKDRVLRAIPTSDTLGDAMAFAGVTDGTFYRWKKQDPVFVRRLERAVEQMRSRKGTRKSQPIQFDPFRTLPPVPGLEQFRREVFGFPSTPTQQAFCRAYDDKTNLIIFWVAPAGAGKDVTLAQATAHAAAEGLPRIGWLMESQPQAKKRVNAYLDPYFTDPSLYKRIPDIPGGMMPVTDFIKTWGPWKWDKNMMLPDGNRPIRTPWEQHQKWFVGRTTPMVDPSLWAVGLEGSIAGSRVQMMVGSDLFTVEKEWRWSGVHYQRTAEDWLTNFGANRREIEAVLRPVYGRQTRLWMRRWRWFFLATSGLFGTAEGSEWGVSHYRMMAT